MKRSSLRFFGATCLFFALLSTANANPTGFPYASIQEAVDANPGRMVYLPPCDYEIREKIRIRTDNGGLFGPGRIIQRNADQPIIEIEDAKNVRLRNLTLTRPEGRMETRTEAVIAIRCKELVLADLRIMDNRTNSAAICLRQCDGARITGCLIRNYMRISVDDRTDSPDWGYAFRCIDGHGIAVRDSRDVAMESNRIVETRLLPTPEVQRQYKLGTMIRKRREKGAIVAQKVWDHGRVDNWHQGAAILVTTPEESDRILIRSNSIQNAAQGIDIHADHVTVTENIIDNAFAGMKAMHGSRHVIITGNQFIRNDLWAIGLMPGAAAHAARGNEPANADGGSLIANNIVSRFGQGSAHWVWGEQGTPIRFDEGQKPENPPLSGVLVIGNIVFDSQRDAVKRSPPRYQYAVRIAPDIRGLTFVANQFDPGTEGVSNRPLQP